MGSGEANRLWLAGIVAVGLALRIANAETALLHDDEKTHAASDAMWSLSRLSVAETVRFLREHPHDHPRLYPVRGAVEPWTVTKGSIAFWGHPTLSSFVTGLVFAVVRPATPEGAVRTVRSVNVAADTAALALLPSLVRALGAGDAAGLLAAALYAVFPLAVSSSSIAYFDPLLAPLMVLLVRTLARLSSLAAGARLGGWIATGVLSGLLISTKETGLVVLASVPIAALTMPHLRVRGLAAWALVTAAVVVVFTSPSAYLARLAEPPDPIARVQLAPWAQLVGNLRMLATPLDHFWIGWTKHGSPRAPLLSRPNVYVAPLYAWGALAAAALALARRDGRVLLLVVPPIALTLAAVPVTGAVRRLQMIAPLLCALIACAWPPLSRRARTIALLAALALAAEPLLPLRPRPMGRLDLADLLFHNPQARQRSTFFRPHQGQPLVLRLPSEVGIQRRLWLAPGKYRVRIDAEGPLQAFVDGQPALLGTIPSPVEVTGHVHLLEMRSVLGSTVRSITIRPGWTPERPAGSPDHAPRRHLGPPAQIATPPQAAGERTSEAR